MKSTHDSRLTTNYLLVAAIASSLLVACTASTAINQAKKTASGVINPIVDTAKDAQKRAEDAQAALKKIQEGVEELKKAAK